MEQEGAYTDLNRSYLSMLMGGLLKRPLLVVLACFAVTAACGWQMRHVSFRTSIYDMVVERLPETARYNTFREVYGSDEIIRVVMRTEGIFLPENFTMVETMSDAVERLQGVKRVISLPVIKRAVEMSGKWDLNRFRDMIQPVNLFKRNLISDDQKTTVLTVVLSTADDREGVILEIQDLIDNLPRQVTAYQIGMPVVSREMARYTANDFKRLPAITLLIVAVLLWIVFRNVAVTVAVLATVVSALMWTIGLMGWLNIPLSMMTMVVPVFLIAVGTAYCMHIVSTYMACRQQAGSSLQSLLETYRNVFLPTILTVFTTIIGLTSLLVNRIQAIHEFALLSCFGMLSLLVHLLSAFPASLLLVSRFDRQAPQQHGGGDPFTKILSVVVRLNLNHRKPVLISILGLLLLSVVGMFFMRVETNPMGFFKARTAVSRHFHDIYRDLSGSFPVNVVVDGGEDDYFENPQNIARIRRIQDYLETLPGVDKTVSFADYMQLVNYATNQYKTDYYRLPAEGFEARMLINSYKTMLGDDMLTSFMNPSYSKANILLLTHLSSSREFLDIKKAVLAHVKAEFPEVPGLDVTGFGMVVAASSHLLTWGQAKSFSLTMLLIFTTMLILFLSVRVGFIAVLPNAFPIIVCFGMMGWTGIHLSMVTSMIASIAIGLAVDDTIHYMVRYNREFKKDLDKDRALRDSILHVGRPILLTTITIGLGFAVLLFSSFKPTSIFGLLMVITMGAALIGDLLILPSLMLNVELVTAWDLLKLMPTLSGISNSEAHELNQPLNAIKMGSDYLKMIVRKDTEVKAEKLSPVADEIGKQVDRASDIIRRLTAFGYKPGFKKEPTDVNKAIEESLVLVESRMKIEGIKLSLDLEDRLPYINAHPTKISEVMFNLLTNACEAIEAKKSAREPFQDGPCISVRSFARKNLVGIAVSDNGIGIPAHLVKRITEPFFTTKASGTGKGLGLSISREIVKNYRGRLEVKSEPGGPTEFVVSFPAHAAEAAGANTAAPV